MTLWKEIFNPQPVNAISINTRVFLGEAWEWIFEKNPDGTHKRAALAMTVIRRAAIQRVKEDKLRLPTAIHVATLDIYFRYRKEKSPPLRRGLVEDSSVTSTHQEPLEALQLRL
jgi:hypothetical protein